MMIETESVTNHSARTTNTSPVPPKRLPTPSPFPDEESVSSGLVSSTLSVGGVISNLRQVLSPVPPRRMPTPFQDAEEVKPNNNNENGGKQTTQKLVVLPSCRPPKRLPTPGPPTLNEDEEFTQNDNDDDFGNPRLPNRLSTPGPPPFNEEEFSQDADNEDEEQRPQRRSSSNSIGTSSSSSHQHPPLSTMMESSVPGRQPQQQQRRPTTRRIPAMYKHEEGPEEEDVGSTTAMRMERLKASVQRPMRVPSPAVTAVSGITTYYDHHHHHGPQQLVENDRGTSRPSSSSLPYHQQPYHHLHDPHLPPHAYSSMPVLPEGHLGHGHGHGPHHHHQQQLPHSHHNPMAVPKKDQYWSFEHPHGGGGRQQPQQVFHQSGYEMDPDSVAAAAAAARAAAPTTHPTQLIQQKLQDAIASLGGVANVFASSQGQQQQQQNDHHCPLSPPPNFGRSQSLGGLMEDESKRTTRSSMTSSGSDVSRLEIVMVRPPKPWHCICGLEHEEEYSFCGFCGTSKYWTCTSCQFDRNKCRFLHCGGCGIVRTSTTTNNNLNNSSNHHHHPHTMHHHNHNHHQDREADNHSMYSKSTGCSTNTGTFDPTASNSSISIPPR